MAKPPHVLKFFVDKSGSTLNSKPLKIVPMSIAKRTLVNLNALNDESSSYDCYYKNSDMEKLLNPFTGRRIERDTVLRFGKFGGCRIGKIISESEKEWSPQPVKDLGEALRKYLITNNKRHGWWLSESIANFVAGDLQGVPRREFKKQLRQNVLNKVKKMTVEEILNS